MFNHSRDEQNVVWARDVERQLVVFRAARYIHAGEELCISYGSRLWFEDTDRDVAQDEDDGSHMLRNILLDS